MKRLFIIIVYLIIMGQINFLFADYIMMCTFFEMYKAKVFRISDYGDISQLYSLDVPFDRYNVCFSPNGKWGLIGGNTDVYNPDMQVTTIMSIDGNRQISILGSVFNDTSSLVSISPDSKYGIYGWDLKSLRHYSNGTYEVIPNPDPPQSGGFSAPFSKLNGNMIGNGGYYTIKEFALLPDGRTTETGFLLDIRPDSFDYCNISPDGRTCIAFRSSDYGAEIVSFQIYYQGGFNMIQTFNPPYDEPIDIGFTPDSKLAIISFLSSPDNPGLVSYTIGEDSTLTEIDAEYLPLACAGQDVAVTPDGKFAVTAALTSSGSVFFVIRIYENGMLEYLSDKNFATSGHVSDIAFVPPQITKANPSWNMYQ
jgi:hypothetical protein